MPKPVDHKELIGSAKHAVQEGLSFDEFCLIITKVIISGQTFEQVKQILINAAIDEIFDEKT